MLESPFTLTNEEMKIQLKQMTVEVASSLLILPTRCAGCASRCTLPVLIMYGPSADVHHHCSKTRFILVETTLDLHKDKRTIEQ